MTDSILRSYQAYSYTSLVPFPFVAPPEAESALELLSGETQGFSFHAESYDSITAAAYVGGPVGGTVAVIDTGTPANNLSDVPLDASNMRNTGTSPKMVTFPASPYVRWSPHNYCLRSQEFDNATAWPPRNLTSISADAIAAPDGTTTAETLTENTSNTAHGVQQDFITLTADTGVVRTYSVYVKNGTVNYVCLAISGETVGTNMFGATFDLTASASAATGATGTGVLVSTSAVDAGGGWYRIAVTGYFTNSDISGLDYEISFRDDAGAPSTSRGLDVYTGTSRTISLWGAQMVRGYDMGPYLVTTTAARMGVPQSYDLVEAKYGVLSEPAASNLALRSEGPSSSWAAIGNITVSDNNIAAPNGITTADLLTGDGTSNAHFIRYTASLSDGFQYTISVYVKDGTQRYMQLFPSGGGDVMGVTYDLQSLTTQVFGSASGTITSTGGGFLRLTATFTLAAATGATFLELAFASALGDARRPTITTSGTIYVWGAQAELGSIATSYIPTIGDPITRARDAVSTTTSTTPAISTEASLWAMVKMLNTNPGYGFFSSSSGNANNKALLYADATNFKSYAAYFSGTTQADFTIGSMTVGTTAKVAGRYALNDFHAAKDGTLSGAPDTSGTMPVSLTQIDLWEQTSVTPHCIIFRGIVLPRIYSNSELQAETA